MSEPVEIPEEFPKIIKDFVSDIINTFPEYEPIIMKWWKPADFSELVEADEIEAAIVADAQEKIKMLFNRCVTIFPERFFDILYQNEDIFKTDSTVNTEFLPGISFKYLWQCDISDKTKETIWKYLQMVLLSIIGSVKNKDAFGDTAKLFKTINEDEFKGKLQETLEKMQSIFENTAGATNNSESESDSGSGINMENMPSADDIHGHITGMLGGKLGDLAREIAEETAENLDIDMENVTDVKDVFQKLFKNPGKLMNLVKNVGDKLDSRIKSGEINEKELMSEASDIMSKMKNMPGMGNIQEMLGKMGMGGLGGRGGGGGGGGGGEGLGNMQEMMEQMGGMDGIQEMMGKMGLGRNKKIDVNAMEAKLERNKKNEQMKERMKKNMILKQQQLQQQQLQQQQLQQQKVSANALSDEQLISVFSTGEKVERTLRTATPNTNVVGEKSSKKKKSKK